jgi:hypothetical protein
LDNIINGVHNEAGDLIAGDDLLGYAVIHNNDEKFA